MRAAVGDGGGGVVRARLAAACELPLDGGEHVGVAALLDLGLDLEAARRRRREEAHVADAGGAHVEGARDGRRREREHVDVRRGALDLLLLLDAEALLLVDDQQPEVAKDDLVAQQRVRPHRDLHRAARDVRAHLGQLRRRSPHQPREQLDAHVRHPRAQHAQVLRREHGRRREEGHLPPVGDGAIDGAHRHLGLAEADVAADQPVHRPRAVHHVLADRLEAQVLVGRRLKRKAVGPLLVLGPVRPARHAGEVLALGVHLEQVGRDGEHARRRLELPLLPRLLRAQPIQPHVDALHLLLGLALEELDVVAVREEDLEVAVAKLDAQILLAVLDLVALVVPRRRDLLPLEEPVEAPNAIALVDDVVAALNLGRLQHLRDELARRGRCHGFRRGWLRDDGRRRWRWRVEQPRTLWHKWRANERAAQRGRLAQRRRHPRGRERQRSEQQREHERGRCASKRHQSEVPAHASLRAEPWPAPRPRRPARGARRCAASQLAQGGDASAHFSKVYIRKRTTLSLSVLYL